MEDLDPGSGSSIHQWARTWGGVNQRTCLGRRGARWAASTRAETDTGVTALDCGVGGRPQ
jgi:hypothetical protein